MYIKLSYNITSQDPIFPGNPKNTIEEVHTIENHGVSTHKIHLFTHNGTHIDLPPHYLNIEKEITEYDINDFIFKKPLLKEINVGAGEKITINDLPYGYDILLIKTNSNRKSKNYLNPPYIDEETAKYLTKFDYKCIGLDCISVTNPNFIEIGEKVHKILLKNQILILEDLNLSKLKKKDELTKIYSIPLFIKGMESSPCTVFVELKERCD